MAQIPLSKKPVWKQQPEEPVKWFDRFWMFLIQEKGHRQVLEAVNLERWEKAQVKGGKFTRVAQVPEEWREASVKYRWVERATDYDRFRVELLRGAEVDQILNARSLSVQSAELAQRTAIAFQELMFDRVRGMTSDESPEVLLTVGRTLKLTQDTAKSAMDMRAVALALQETVSNYGFDATQV